MSDNTETTDTSTSGVSRFRKMAPRPEPDWFWLTSGEVDSVAAYLLTKDALAENYQKRTVDVVDVLTLHTLTLSRPRQSNFGCRPVRQVRRTLVV